MALALGFSFQRISSAIEFAMGGGKLLTRAVGFKNISAQKEWIISNIFAISGLCLQLVVLKEGVSAFWWFWWLIIPFLGPALVVDMFLQWSICDFEEKLTY
mmetsp:Transcript_41008/g.96272  ORF Transcript_41008/g.96272 Transcript_41008/m.96272 type:complete len:101 (-) Transcript_41008:493-795(-)